MPDLPMYLDCYYVSIEVLLTMIRSSLDFSSNQEVRMRNGGIDKDIADFISRPKTLKMVAI